jgi:hypothetical protein
MKRKQQHIFDTLSAKRLPYEAIDVASCAEAKAFLRTHSPRQLELPQLWKRSARTHEKTVDEEESRSSLPLFVGVHEEFENALEGGYLDNLLGVQ